MANLALQKVGITPGQTATGTALTYSNAASGGDEFANAGMVMLAVKTGATATTVTVECQNESNYGFLQPVTITVPANSERLAGPFPVGRFNDTNGKVQVSYSSVTNVQVAAFYPQR